MGRSKNTRPHEIRDKTDIIWNNKLDVISEEVWYEIGNVYGTKEDALVMREKRAERRRTKKRCEERKDLSNNSKAYEIALKYVKKRYGIKNPKGVVKVWKSNGYYSVSYREKVSVLR